MTSHLTGTRRETGLCRRAPTLCSRRPSCCAPGAGRHQRRADQGGRRESQRSRYPHQQRRDFWPERPGRPRCSRTTARRQSLWHIRRDPGPSAGAGSPAQRHCQHTFFGVACCCAVRSPLLDLEGRHTLLHVIPAGYLGRKRRERSYGFARPDGHRHDTKAEHSEGFSAL
jgi:hypothetical protein